jgi:hypothetical protein
MQSSFSVAEGEAQDGGLTVVEPLCPTSCTDPITAVVSLNKSISTLLAVDDKPPSLFDGNWQVILTPTVGVRLQRDQHGHLLSEEPTLESINMINFSLLRSSLLLPCT